MPKKILLADDSITIQKVVELTFSDGDYEVSAVNNGAKAIQKLADFRPDIILSDIIMPEKNGYEVCEFVKSHPEYRNIPVILLTGTFEPFDPDRADKAGCDAVVTKPFESQSLIQKVDELIAAAQSAAPPAAPAEPEPQSFAAETSPWDDEAVTAPQPAEPPPPPPPPPTADPFAGGFQTHDADIFAAAPPSEPSTMETPFDSGAFGGETRAFPKMSWDELQQMPSEPAAPPAPEPPPPAPPEPSPWDEPAPLTGGETRAFPKMSFEELQQMASEPEPLAPEPAAAETMSPFEAPEPPPAPPAGSAAEPSPWDQQPAFSGETRAFSRMSWEELQQMASTPATNPTPEPEPPAPTGAETRAIPRLSLEELQQMSSAPAAAAPQEDTSPWDEPAAEPSAPPVWAPAEESVPSAESFATEAASPFAESLEPQEAPFEPEMTSPAIAPEEPVWAPPQPEPMEPPPVNPQITAVNPQITDVNPQITDLTDDQVDRIARRVVQLMSEQVVRNIAWEVIPDLAEMVVKERIRQLESEA